MASQPDRLDGYMGPDRRDTARRAELVRAVLEVVHGRAPVITVDYLQASLQISPEAASRILERLVSAGLLVESGPGVWVRSATQ
jgi:hypothetical protein